MNHRNRAIGSFLARLSSDVVRLEWRVPQVMCEGPKCGELEKQRGVYWLPRSVTEPSDGAPLCPNPKAARLAVEAPPISVPDPDATPMQLEESEEARRPKHKALPANPYERLRGRQYGGQVQSSLRLYTSGTLGRPQTCQVGRQVEPRLVAGTSLASDEHCVGTSAGVRRCRSIWRRPEKQRWVRRC